MYQSDTFRTAPLNHRVQLIKKFQFYNRPTVHSRFQSASSQQTPTKPTARHHVAAEQEAQDFRPRRPTLTLLTP